MSINTIITRVGSVKTLVLLLSLTSIGVAAISLDHITNRLLHRDAYSVGMHWAEDIVATLDDLDEIFAGNLERSSAPEILRQLSNVGRIYRYEFLDAKGKLVFDTSTYQPTAVKPVAKPPTSTRKLSPNHHGNNGGHHHGGSHGMVGTGHDNHKHTVALKAGDGLTHPQLYAYVVHPITKDGSHMGTLRLYVDQTDTQALMGDIAFAFLTVLSCMAIFAFGLPTALYRRGKTKEKNAKQEFKQQQQRLDAALSVMHQGFCMYDNDGKILVSNDRYATLYNMTPEQVRPGKNMDQVVEGRISSGCYIGNNEGEYRDVVRALKLNPVYTPRTYRLKDGRYVEIRDLKMNDDGWFTIHEDITERVLAKNELMQRNERLDAALKTMIQGVCMFDSDENIVVSNDQYAEIYGIATEQIKPGTPLKDILEHRIKNGTYGGSGLEQYRLERMDWSMSEENGVKIHHLQDGRYIEIRDHPMANGGWLSIHEDVTERHEAEKRIKYLANFDALTDLPNRSQIRERLDSIIRNARKNDSKMALLYIDLDGFKEVNDTLGHPVGDRVLKEVGLRLKKSLSGATIVGRLSGDEFIAIVKKYDDLSDLKQLGDKICTAIAAPFHLDPNIVDISASIGIATGPPTDGDAETIIQFSDLALYQAKADGGNSYRFFEYNMYTRAKERQQMAADLHSAISNDELLLHYQPQVDLSTGVINGYEALVRWQHGDFGMISPLQFIGLAEETGQINEIGEWVLRNACEYAVSWPNREKVSVNLSPIQFKRQNIVEMVKNVLDQTGLEPERLELEITESVLIQGADSVVATLQTLSDMGISIALDDFGTGFSSLSYLVTFPFNKIKIDKSFIDGLGTDSEVTAIVSMITGLGRSLDRVVTAEGIEKTSQHELLRAAGCNQGQGYLYGKPLPHILEVKQPREAIQA